MAKSMNSEFGIHTICYAPGMAASIDPAFLPFDVSATPEAERREIAHMLAFWRQGRHRDYAVSALLAPKFSEKTRLAGNAFVDFILANPDYDVWLVNPFPHYHYLSFNIWEHGEFFHPGLGGRANALFSAVGMDIDVTRLPRSNPATLLFSNCWAATPAFWDRFMGDVEALAAVADRTPQMFEPAPYNPNQRVAYFPFFFERYLTTFLAFNSDLRVCAWTYSLNEIVARCDSEMGSAFVKEWAPIIDRWDAAGSYSEQQRLLFRQIQAFYGSLLTWKETRRQAELHLRKP